MTVTSIDKDYDGLALVVVADFDAPVERVWQLWADPRKLERWWGPPGYPATFEQHELTRGGGVTYYMTDPDGSKYRGWWRVESVEPPHTIEFSDGFADDNGDPLTERPVTKNRVTLSEHAGGTRMELRTAFDSREQFDELEAMGMVEGLEGAIGQIDALLAEEAGIAR